MHRRAQSLVCAIVAVLSLLTCGCGAKGDLYLPDQNQEQKR